MTHRITSMCELMTQLQQALAAQEVVFIRAFSHNPDCIILGPVFESFHRQSKVRLIEFDEGQAIAVSRYFGVHSVPDFVCILPSRHPTLTPHELRHNGTGAKLLREWMNDILLKWRGV